MKVKGKYIMKKLNHILLIVFTLLLSIIFAHNCKAEIQHLNFQLDRSITDETTKFWIIYDNSGCVIDAPYKNASLYVTSNDKLLFKRKCFQNGTSTGICLAKIPKQKAGSKIKIFLKDSNDTTNIKTITVKSISAFYPQNTSSKIARPSIIHLNYNTYIKGRKGDTIIFNNGKKAVKKVKLNDNTLINLNCLEKYLQKSELYVYTRSGKSYSKNYLLIPKTFYINE